MSGIVKLIHAKRIAQLNRKSDALKEMKKETPKSKSVRSEIIENLELLTELELKMELKLYQDKE